MKANNAINGELDILRQEATSTDYSVRPYVVLCVRYEQSGV